MKFKKGDRVRILPSAVDVNVASDEVGKTGVIVNYNSPKDMVVLMDKPRKYNGFTGSDRIDWIVDCSQIELAIVPGRQLLLWDDLLE